MNRMVSGMEGGPPFVCFSLPGSQEFSTWTLDFLPGRSWPHPGEAGFLFHPFHPDALHPALFLTRLTSISGIPAGSLPQPLDPLPSVPHQSPEDHAARIGLIQNEIRNGGVEKVVLSRSIPRVDSGFSADFSFLEELRRRYPWAFVYLFHFEKIGTWAGASPELLLEARGRAFRTMALAGTRRNGGSDAPWGAKECHEQAVVTDFLLHQIQRFHPQELQLKGPFTTQAGPVEHLCTELRFVLPAGEEGLTSLLKAIHPTPAVCGLPRTKALDWIRCHEGYPRAYYTGFLGPVEPDQASLYVNLRCLKFHQDGVVVYAGGGITAGSEPESEWQETELKAQTLLRALADNHPG